jgi:glycosyltransferase involved in cell wall biosynthesis
MKVSVLITTKDRESFLLRAVSSIFSNTVKPDEIVIVNDGGKDVALTLFSDFLDEISINIHNTRFSEGANKARNRAIDISSGEIIFFLDDDDALTFNSIENRLKIFNSERDNLGLVYTGKNVVKSDSLNKIIYKISATREGELFSDLLTLGNIIGSTSCVAVYRQTLLDVGCFDEALPALQDYELWLRISKVKSIYHDGGAGINYTIHTSNQQISSNYQRYLDAGNYIFKKYSNDINSSSLARQFLAKRYLRVAMAASKSSASIRLIYAFKSFMKKPSLKAIFLFIPYSISKRIKTFT